MKSTKIGALALLASSMLVVGIWNSRATRRAEPDSSPPAETAARDPAFSEAADEGARKATSSSPSQLTEQSLSDIDSGRTALSPPVVSAQLVTPDRRPIGGARVSWTPLLDAFLAADHAWSAQDWKAVEESSLFTTSATDGSFAFAAAPTTTSQHGSVIWITHGEHMAEPLVLGADMASWSIPAVIQMQPAASMWVRVVDAEQAPVPAARVEQIAIISDTLKADSIEVRVRCVLRRVFETDRTGRVQVDPFASEQCVVASREDLSSEPWLGMSRRELSLTLRPTFTAKGQLKFDAGSPIEGELRVICSLQRGSRVRVLSTLKPDPRGAFGPVSLPLLDADVYRFRLEGGNVVPKLALVQPPRAGETITVGLQAEAGIDLWFQIIGPDGQPLPDAEAIVRWDDEGNAMESRARPRDDGYTIVRGCRPGLVQPEARAPGYALCVGVPTQLPETPWTRVVQLLPAGALTGRVTHTGAPVEDFEITFWPTADKNLKVVRSFSAREDGAFEIADAPTGEVSVLAMSADYPRSETHQVSIGTDKTPSVVIELSESLLGKGKVVDQATGEPLPSARVQHYANDQRSQIAPWGPPRSVGSDGSFELRGFASGTGLLLVAAPGYSNVWRQVFGRQREDIDLGLISMPRRQTLEVRLVSDTDFDPTGYTVFGEGTDVVPPHSFGADRTARIDAVSVGSYLLHLLNDRPNEERFLLQSMILLEPGKEWVLEFPVAGSRRLVVEVVTKPEETRHPLSVVVTLPSSNALSVLRTLAVPPDGVVTVDGLAQGEVQVNLIDAGGAKLVDATAQIGDRGSEVHLRLSPLEQAYRIRVVDESRIPVPNAVVSFGAVDNKKSASSATTDAQGECTIEGLAPGLYYNHITHQAIGEQLGKLIELERNPPDVMEIEFVADTRAEIHLVDGAEPQPAVPCRMFDPSGRITMTIVATNAGGLARWDKISQGEYRLKVAHTGYWPVEALVTSAKNAPPTPVQIRRLGDLAVETKGSSGAVVPNQTVDLTSVEFGESVGSWIERGLVKAPTHGLATDDDGRLRVGGLPHGDYRWRVQTLAGDVYEGLTTVASATVSDLAIVIP